MKTLSLYIHWPFCKSKCPYCDFNSHVREQVPGSNWIETYLAELSYFAEEWKGKVIKSIFFGGGTPTLMPPALVSALLNALSARATLAPDIEITLEGNPTSIEAGTFTQFADAGVNRVSLGVQSLEDKALRFLGREHSANEALAAVEHAAHVFPNYTFDLIYTLPEQRVSQWEKQLVQALKFAAKHMSLYQLTIEKGTPFYRDFHAQKFTLPDEDTSAEFYEVTQDIMEDHGLPWYEISNHSAPGFESRHNMNYWEYGDYLGLGAGAHSRMTRHGKKHALMMVHNPEGWHKAVQEQGAGLQHDTPLTSREVLEELTLMGLRTRKGIQEKYFRQVTGQDFRSTFPALEKLVQQSLLVLEDGHLRISKQGRLLVNAVVGELLEHFSF